MSKKPRKVAEPKASYPASKPAAAGASAPNSDTSVKYADLNTVRTTNARLVQAHKMVLEKLAR